MKIRPFSLAVPAALFICGPAQAVVTITNTSGKAWILMRSCSPGTVLEDRGSTGLPVPQAIRPGETSVFEPIGPGSWHLVLHPAEADEETKSGAPLGRDLSLRVFRTDSGAVAAHAVAHLAHGTGILRHDGASGFTILPWEPGPPAPPAPLDRRGVLREVDRLRILNERYGTSILASRPAPAGTSRVQVVILAARARMRLVLDSLEAQIRNGCDQDPSLPEIDAAREVWRAHVVRLATALRAMLEGPSLEVQQEASRDRERSFGAMVPSGSAAVRRAHLEHVERALAMVRELEWDWEDLAHAVFEFGHGEPSQAEFLRFLMKDALPATPDDVPIFILARGQKAGVPEDPPRYPGLLEIDWTFPAENKGDGGACPGITVPIRFLSATNRMAMRREVTLRFYESMERIAQAPRPAPDTEHKRAPGSRQDFPAPAEPTASAPDPMIAATLLMGESIRPFAKAFWEKPSENPSTAAEPARPAGRTCAPPGGPWPSQRRKKRRAGKGVQAVASAGGRRLHEEREHKRLEVGRALLHPGANPEDPEDASLPALPNAPGGPRAGGPCHPSFPGAPGGPSEGR